VAAGIAAAGALGGALLAATSAVAVQRANASSVSGNVSMSGIWTGDEQKSFQAVLKGFNKLYPNVHVHYQGAGNNLPTVLATAVRGGNPPDLAAIGQPGTVRDFATQGKLKPITFARGLIAANYSPDWLKLGTINGKLYGVFFKGANKSTVWYSVPAFKQAGVTPPKTWPQLLQDAKTLKSSGIPAYSLGGADAWPLTDIFENVYLRQAGPKKYDQLATHKIPWTDPSVKKALQTVAQVVGDTGNFPGGSTGLLQTSFPDSVTQVFGTPRKAAMVFEGDFVATNILDSTKAKPLTGFNQFPFPSVNGSKPAVMGGGDEVVMFKDSPAAEALVKYLATPVAATIWARRGGFSSPNKRVPARAYPDPITRATATALAKAKTFRFDLSDLQPAAFGATTGQGLWKDFQDFAKNPSNVNGVTAEMESGAKAAYKTK
jgi:ABC-type glycerol-3-phosphate transport system substrate-binding protein